MIESKNYVPYVYKQSRDYQALCKILDLIINATKVDIDTFVNLLSPEKCPDHMLPLLADYVGYEYDNKESYDTNRLIIKYFPYLIHNRGSELGVKLATALTVNAAGGIDDLMSLENFKVEYSKKDGKIIIYIYYPNYLSKIKDLIEVVRPAGVRCELVPAAPISSSENIDLEDKLSVNIDEYEGTDRYKISSDPKEGRIGHTEIAKDIRG